MYENYTKQSLPTKEYRELLGTAICVFNGNTTFIVEILRYINPKLSWYTLTDKTSGKLQNDIDKYINKYDKDISILYENLTKQRNRIVHSFRITSKDSQQILGTKTQEPENTQFEISEEYMYAFIKENDKLSDKLNALRNQLKKP